MDEFDWSNPMFRYCPTNVGQTILDDVDSFKKALSCSVGTRFIGQVRPKTLKPPSISLFFNQDLTIFVSKIVFLYNQKVVQLNVMIIARQCWKIFSKDMTMTLIRGPKELGQ